MLNNDTLDMLTYDEQFYYDKIVRHINRLPQGQEEKQSLINELDELIEEIMNND